MTTLTTLVSLEGKRQIITMLTKSGFVWPLLLEFIQFKYILVWRKSRKEKLLLHWNLKIIELRGRDFSHSGEKSQVVGFFILRFRRKFGLGAVELKVFKRSLWQSLQVNGWVVWSSQKSVEIWMHMQRRAARRNQTQTNQQQQQQKSREVSLSLSDWTSVTWSMTCVLPWVSPSSFQWRLVYHRDFHTLISFSSSFRFLGQFSKLSVKNWISGTRVLLLYVYLFSSWTLALLLPLPLGLM